MVETSSWLAIRDTRFYVLRDILNYFKLLSNIFNKPGIKGKRYSRIVDTITQIDPAMKMAPSNA